VLTSADEFSLHVAGAVGDGAGEGELLVESRPVASDGLKLGKVASAVANLQIDDCAGGEYSEIIEPFQRCLYLGLTGDAR
jgi:hypothetical protein